MDTIFFVIMCKFLTIATKSLARTIFKHFAVNVTQYV